MLQVQKQSLVMQDGMENTVKNYAPQYVQKDAHKRTVAVLA